MKKTVLALTMAASVLALSACSDKNTDEEIIATSKNGEITKADLYDEMKDAIGIRWLKILFFKKRLKVNIKFQTKKLKEAIEKQKEQYGDSFEMYLMQNGMTEEVFRKKRKISIDSKKMIESLEVSR